MKARIDLCIAIPTINELANLKILLPELRNHFPEALIMIIDDGSSDGTTDFIEHLSNTDDLFKLISRSTRQGIGSAHKCAFKVASEIGVQFLITMDGDLTHRTVDALRAREKLEGNDIVIGSRYLEDSEIVGWSMFRLSLTRLGHLATRVFFKSNLDMSSGLRAYRVDSIPLSRVIRNCPSNYEFFFISTLVFLKSGLRIAETPITLLERKSGRSKMSIKLMIGGSLNLFLFGTRIKRILP